MTLASTSTSTTTNEKITTTTKTAAKSQTQQQQTQAQEEQLSLARLESKITIVTEGFLIMTFFSHLMIAEIMIINHHTTKSYFLRKYNYR
jgi:hypothetical protein